jgi:hypothetical protein
VIKNPFTGKNSQYICSEFVAALLEDIIPISFKKDLNSIEPIDVENVVKNINGIIKIT